MKLIISFFAIVLIVSCKNEEKKITITEDEPTQTTQVAVKIVLRNFNHEDVARYTMASVMGQIPKIIKVTKNDDLYYVSYIRKSDKQKFEYKIKFEDDKIFWANIDGRWRDSKYDEKITFVENGNKLNIIQTFSDGSEDIKVYRKGD
jgi:hypothetical protein